MWAARSVNALHPSEDYTEAASSSENMNFKVDLCTTALTLCVTGRLYNHHVLFALTLVSCNPGKLLVVNFILLWLSSESLYTLSTHRATSYFAQAV